MKQEFTSAATSINSSRCPAIYSKPNVVPYLVNKRVLDYGGGKYDTAINRAKRYGCEVKVYDPYNRSESENLQALQSGPYDCVISSNVLNVIKEPEVRAAVVRDMARHCKERGVMFFTVYEGDKSGVGRQTGKDQWQENRPIESYMREVAHTLAQEKCLAGVRIANKVLTVWVH